MITHPTIGSVAPANFYPTFGLGALPFRTGHSMLYGLHMTVVLCIPWKPGPTSPQAAAVWTLVPEFGHVLNLDQLR